MNEDFKKKLKIMALFFGVLLLILLIIFLLLLYNKPKTKVNNINNENNNTVVNQPSQTTTPSQNTPVATSTQIIGKPVVKEKKTVDDVAKIAASFAERFGTYSNQSGFSNMTDLQMYMTKKMQTWADTYVADLKKQKHDVYYGITTSAVVQEIKSFDDEAGKATILVKTRRREATNSIGNVSKIFNQDITVELIKNGTTWKIDGVFWGKKE